MRGSLEATDGLGRDDYVVEVPLLVLNGSIVPIVFEEKRVDAVFGVGTHEVEILCPRLETAIDPKFLKSVFKTGIIEADMCLDTVPGVGVCRVENGGDARRNAQPVEVAEIVVSLTDGGVTAHTTGGVEQQVVVAVSPEMRNHRLGPIV